MMFRRLFSITALALFCVVTLAACAKSSGPPPTATARLTNTPMPPSATPLPPEGICTMISAPEVEAVFADKLDSTNLEKITNGTRCTFVMQVKFKVAVISLTTGDDAAFADLQKKASNPSDIKDFGAKVFAQKTDTGATVTFFKGTQIGQIAVSGTKDNLAVATAFARLLSSRI